MAHVSSDGRDRRSRNPTEDDEQPRTQPAPVATPAESEIDPRAMADVLRGARPAGRGSAAVVARAIERLQGGHGNAAIGRALAAGESAQALAGGSPPQRAAGAEEPTADAGQVPAAPEQDGVDQSAVIADLPGIGARVAERVAAGARADVLYAVVDFETDFLVLELTRAAGKADFEVTSSHQAGRAEVSDQTLDGYVSGSDVPPGSGQIATAAAELLAHPRAIATIEGFTDDVGKAAVNDPLSLRRAEQAREAIIAAAPGLTAENFHVAGRGASDFVAPNLTDADRRRNRRVRVRVEEPA
jgi:flagellar motor protein MotB